MSDIQPDRPLRPEYLAAYLGLAWHTDADAGLRIWLDEFQQALDRWQGEVCQRLLTEIKQTSLAPEGIGLVRYVEGRWAEQRGDLEHAVRSYNASLELNREVGDDMQIAQVLGDLGLAYHAQGRLQEAKAALEESLTIYRPIEDREDIFGVLNTLGSVLVSLGEWNGAQACLHEAAGLATNDTEQATVLGNLGVWHQAQSQSTAALDCFQQALAYFRTAGAISDAAGMLNNLAALALDTHSFHEVGGYLSEAIGIYQTMGDWSNVVRLLGNLALYAQESGHIEEALQRYGEAIAGVGELTDNHTLGILHNHRGLLYLDTYQWALAARDFETSLDHLATVGDLPTEAAVWNNLGTAYRHINRLDEALASYRHALNLAEMADDRRRIGEVTGNLGHLYDLQEDLAQAVAAYTTSVDISREIQDPGMEAIALMGLSSIAWQRSELEKLDSLLEQVWQVSQASEQFDVLAQAGWLYGDVASVRGGNLAAIFEPYAQAVVHAAMVDESLVKSSLERIDIHLRFLAKQNLLDSVRTACQILNGAWQTVELFDLFPYLGSYLDKRQSPQHWAT